MPRIIVAECKQEVSSFNPAPSCFEDFRTNHGTDIFDYHRQVREEVGGALSVFDQHPDVELIGTFAARSNTSGGVLSAESFRQLSQELLNSLADVSNVDAFYFSLHGAMQAECEDDPEGYFLEQARAILGESVPIVLSLDLHGILTDKMLKHSNAAVCFHTYPHVDFFETGARAAALVMKILKRGVLPVTARVKIPALVRGDELITSTGAIGECIRMAQQIEASPRGLSAGVMWGNPFTDVPDLRTNSFAVMDGDKNVAIEHAIALANCFWKHHERMQVPLVSLQESARMAAKVRSGTVVMMDAADATSSGAAGDSNAIIKELMQQNYRGQVLAPIFDPAAAGKAFAEGVGAEIDVTLGGAFDRGRFTPIPLRAKVRMLFDGKFRSESFGWHWDSGPTAVIQANNYTFVVGTRPVSLFDRSWFYSCGQDPKRFDLVIVKSPHCEHHMFREWCALQINVDAPGSTSANVRGLGHKKCPRPIFPLDEGLTFSPQAEIFDRSASD